MTLKRLYPAPPPPRPMDARCPECGRAATLDEQVQNVDCPHCGFHAGYEDYLEIMKEKAINMSSDYIPDRPGI